MPTIDKRMRVVNLWRLYCCACVCIKHHKSVQQLQPVSLKLQMDVNDVVIKHAHITMSLFVDQLDFPDIQFKTICRQLSKQTNHSKFKLAFNQYQLTLTFWNDAHFEVVLIEIVVEWSKVSAFEVVLIENRRNSCWMK